jgi:hypothetical protein
MYHIQYCQAIKSFCGFLAVFGPAAEVLSDKNKKAIFWIKYRLFKNQLARPLAWIFQAKPCQ